MLDSLISALLAQTAVLESTCNIVVSVHELPNRVDAIYDLISIPNLGSRLAVVDNSGAHLGVSALAEQVAAALSGAPVPDDDVDRGILRHRGVFRGRSSGRVSNYLFYYEALPKASAGFQQRLVEALSAARPDVVVFDTSTSGPWFASMVQAACVQLQTTHSAKLTSVDIGQWVAYQSGRLDEPERSRVQAAERALSADAAVAVVVPAYASGRSLTRALELVGSPDLNRTTAVAVFADAAASLRPSHLPGIHGVATQPYGGKTIDVHCMRQVELRTLDREHWLVAAAEVLGEVRDLPVEQVEHGQLGTVALWSLYADCGVDVERVPPGRRAPKRYFPDLARLDDWDAHWLAEAAVANMLQVLPKSNRAALLIVIPSEENGTQPIARALTEQCGTAVLRVPRAMLEGLEPPAATTLEKLRRHTADTIVILDESTVTHETLEKLARFVEASVRVPPDLIGAMIDVSSKGPRLEIPYFSLARWAALAEGATA